VHVAEILHRRDVGAGGEGFLASGQNDRSDAGIGVERGERPAELGHELRTERVKCFGRFSVMTPTRPRCSTLISSWLMAVGMH